jgi:hypothetical protein
MGGIGGRAINWNYVLADKNAPCKACKNRERVSLNFDRYAFSEVRSGENVFRKRVKWEL